LEKPVQRARDYVLGEAVGIKRAKDVEQSLKRQLDSLQYIEQSLPTQFTDGLVADANIQCAPHLMDSMKTVCSVQDTSPRRSNSGSVSQSACDKIAAFPELLKVSAGLGPRKPLQPPPLTRLRLEEFEAVPQYMRGRLAYEKLQLAVDEIEVVLREKYALLSIPIGKMTEKMMKRYKAFKDQENNETKGRFFFSDSDLRQCKHLRVDATGKAILTVLRHLGRIRNARGSGVTKYIICP